jgi:hypothetical protein
MWRGQLVALAGALMLLFGAFQEWWGVKLDIGLGQMLTFKVFLTDSAVCSGGRCVDGSLADVVGRESGTFLRVAFVTYVLCLVAAIAVVVGGGLRVIHRVALPQKLAAFLALAVTPCAIATLVLFPDAAVPEAHVRPAPWVARVGAFSAVFGTVITADAAAAIDRSQPLFVPSSPDPHIAADLAIDDGGVTADGRRLEWRELVALRIKRRPSLFLELVPRSGPPVNVAHQTRGLAGDDLADRLRRLAARARAARPELAIDEPTQSFLAGVP